MSSVERQVPDELCKDNAINTGTNDYAVIVVVAAGSHQGKSAGQRRVAPSLSVCSHDLDDCISYFSNTGSSVDGYALVHRFQAYDSVGQVASLGDARVQW